MKNEQERYKEMALCEKCYIKLVKPSKREIKRMVMTEYDELCDNCGKFKQIVDYIEED